MNIQLCKRRNQALGIVGLLIFLAALIIIAGTIIYMLWKVCQRAFPTTGNPPPGTNALVVEWDGPVTLDNNAPADITMPLFRFPEITNPPPGATAEKPLGTNMWTWIFRSTNLVDWDVMIRTNEYHPINVAEDTNPPAPAVFYRMMFDWPTQ